MQTLGTSATHKTSFWQKWEILHVALLAVTTSVAYLFTAVSIGRISVSTLLWTGCAAGIVGTLVAIIWPRLRSQMTYALAATTIIFSVMRLSHPWLVLLQQSPLSPTFRYWLVNGPGNGLLGFLPATLLVLLLGRSVFHLSIVEQWAGKTTITWTAAWYGGGVGITLAALTIGLALTLGAAGLDWHPYSPAHVINLVSNLYEEVLARGVLLQVIRRKWNDRVAMLWTGLVFGMMHGLNEKAVFIALISWTIAWAVIRARSLWAGWIAHQVMDVVVDTLLPS